MTSRRALGAVICLLVLMLLGGSAQGCADHRSARQLSPSSPTSADLVVENRSPNTVNVYVSGSNVGSVQPNTDGRFQVLSGTRRVEVRETGHSAYYSFGDVYFGFSVVTLTYRP